MHATLIRAMWSVEIAAAATHDIALYLGILQSITGEIWRDFRAPNISLIVNIHIVVWNYAAIANITTNVLNDAPNQDVIIWTLSNGWTKNDS